MAKFLFVYRGGDEGYGKLSAEQLQQYMQKWMSWIEEGMQAGWMLDPGDALKPEGRVVRADRSVTDGPFAESKELVGGYSVINSEDFDEASELAKGCPVLITGGFVEIREMALVAQELIG